MSTHTPLEESLIPSSRLERLSEYTSLAVRRLLFQNGDRRGTWSETEAIATLAILELDWISLPSETGARGFGRGTTEKLLAQLGASLLDVSWGTRTNNMWKTETDLRVLSAALRLYKAYAIPLDHDLHLFIYEDINKLWEKFEFFRDTDQRGRIEAANVKFLLKHCQYTLASIDTTELPSRLIARRAIFPQDSMHSSPRSDLDSQIADLMSRRRERPKWHDELLSLEDACWSVYGQDIIYHVFPESTRFDEVLSSVSLVSALLRDAIISHLGQGKFKITAHYPLYSPPNSPPHTEYGEDTIDDFCFGVLDLMYGFSLRICGDARRTCYGEFLKVIRSVLETTPASNSLLFEKAIELWNHICPSQVKSPEEECKYGDTKDRAAIKAWINQRPPQAESFHYSTMRSKLYLTQLKLLRRQQINILSEIPEAGPARRPSRDADTEQEWRILSSRSSKVTAVAATGGDDSGQMLTSDSGPTKIKSSNVDMPMLTKARSRKSKAALSSLSPEVSKPDLPSSPSARQTMPNPPSLSTRSAFSIQSTFILSRDGKNSLKKMKAPLVATCISPTGSIAALVAPWGFWVYKLLNERSATINAEYVGMFLEQGDFLFKIREGEVKNHGPITDDGKWRRFDQAGLSDDLLVLSTSHPAGLFVFSISSPTTIPFSQLECPGRTVQKIFFNHQGTELAIVFCARQSKAEDWEFYATRKLAQKNVDEQASSISHLSSPESQVHVNMSHKAQDHVYTFRTRDAKFSQDGRQIVACTNHFGGSAFVFIFSKNNRVWFLHHRSCLSSQLDPMDGGCLGFSGVAFSTHTGVADDALMFSLDFRKRAHDFYTIDSQEGTLRLTNGKRIFSRAYPTIAVATTCYQNRGVQAVVGHNGRIWLNLDGTREIGKSKNINPTDLLDNLIETVTLAFSNDGEKLFFIDHRGVLHVFSSTVISKKQDEKSQSTGRSVAVIAPSTLEDQYISTTTPESMHEQESLEIRELLEWFRLSDSGDEECSSMSELVSGLAELANLPPSNSNYTQVHALVLSYLRISLTRYPGGVDRLQNLFAGLYWLYPMDPYIKLAMAKACLQNSHPDTEHAFVMLNEMHRTGSIPTEMRNEISDHVLPDLKRIIHKSVFVSPDSSRLLHFQWKAPRVFRDSPSSCIDLPQLIVLTEVIGTADGKSETRSFMRADRVHDFVEENWGQTGSLILRTFTALLEEVLGRRETIHIKKCGDWFTLLANPDVLAVSAICLKREWDEFLKCLLWIDEVVGSPNESSGLRRLRAFPGQPGTRVKSVLFDLQIAELESLIESNKGRVRDNWGIDDVLNKVALQHYRYLGTEGERVDDTRITNSCWIELVEKGFVGTYYLSYPVPPNVGEGLRLSFELMCILAGIEREISFDNNEGKVLTGFCTAVIPVKVISDWGDERSIQWHVVIQKPSDNRFRSIHDRPEFRDLIPPPSDRLKDTTGLKGIAYLGWTREAEFKFGNEDREHCYKSSSLKPTPFFWNASQRSHAVSGQIGIPFNGPTIGYQRQRTQVKSAVVFRYASGESSFKQRLTGFFNAKVFIYDQNCKIAWLCPQIVLMMHLLHLHLRKSNHTFRIACPILRIGSTDEEIQAHVDSLVCHFETNIRDNETYATILTRFADIYSEAFRKFDEAPRTDPFDHLRGFELIDLLKQGEPTAPKILPANNGVQHWCALVGILDVVFCRGIGHVIEPSEITLAPCTYAPIEGQNILVCPIPLLVQILQSNGMNPKDGCIEGNGYKWEYTGSPFGCERKVDAHEGDNFDDCWLGRLQKFTPYRRFHLHRMLPSLRRNIRRQKSLDSVLGTCGVICFGEIKARPRRQEEKSGPDFQDAYEQKIGIATVRPLYTWLRQNSDLGSERVR